MLGYPGRDTIVYFCKYRRKSGGSLAKYTRDLELFLAPACGIYNYLNKSNNERRHMRMMTKDFFIIQQKLGIDISIIYIYIFIPQETIIYYNTLHTNNV